MTLRLEPAAREPEARPYNGQRQMPPLDSCMPFSRHQVLPKRSPWTSGQTSCTGKAMGLEVSTNAKGWGTIGCGLGQILHYLFVSVEAGSL